MKLVGLNCKIDDPTEAKVIISHTLTKINNETGFKVEYLRLTGADIVFAQAFSTSLDICNLQLILDVDER